MRQKYFFSLGDGGFHRIAYTEWGDHDNPHVVVCVHGLARNSRDFDFLAEALAQDCRVVCMDVVGRGDSDWLDNKSEYTFTTYLADAAAMLARVTAPAAGTWLERLRGGPPPPMIDWVGTSMGGLIGMFLAAKRNAPIRRLVLNDLWNIWGRLKCPTLVLRGAKSEVLVASTLKEMRERRPDTVSVEFEGVGHVPALMSEDQIAPVRQFLLQQ